MFHTLWLITMALCMYIYELYITRKPVSEQTIRQEEQGTNPVLHNSEQMSTKIIP